jgi:toxin FitB
MIILDTNVISESVNPSCDPSVRRWLNRQVESEIYSTTVNLAEIYAGLELLPEGKRQQELRERVDGLLVPLFAQKLLPFDVKAAISYAGIFGNLRRKGRSISPADCQIASIAETNGFLIATRDEQPFRDAGLRVINPWTDE